MKRVLITGATGFIGRHCLPLLLKRGYEVHAVSSRIPGMDLPDTAWHLADLRSPEQVSGLMTEVQPTHLLHFAWYTVPGEYWNSSENLSWVGASLELAQAFARSGGQRVVMAGTCAEYDWRYGYCSESVTPLAPRALYGICKHSLQMMLSSFAENTGLSAAWGRIFFVYGPHEDPARLIPSVVCALLKGEPAYCTHGNQIRDFLYVEDVAEAFVEILESNFSGTINVASGHPVALKDIILTIADRFNRSDLVELGSISAPTDEPPMIVADVSLLRNKVGWQPKFDLRQGLDRTIAWWKRVLAERNQ